MSPNLARRDRDTTAVLIGFFLSGASSSSLNSDLVPHLPHFWVQLSRCLLFAYLLNEDNISDVIVRLKREFVKCLELCLALRGAQQG